MVDHIDLDSFFDEDQIHPWIGCTTDRGIPKGYWKDFTVYEQSTHDLSAKGNTLKKWKGNAPEKTQFVARLDSQLISHPDVLKAEKSEEFKALFHRCVVRCLALESPAVLLHTPAHFRPSSINEKRVIEIVRLLRETLNDQAPHLIWRADGLWEESETYLDLCSDQKLIASVDPLMWPDNDPLPKSSHYYWRILGQRGLSTRLSDFDLDRLAEFSSEMKCPGWVIFASPHLFSIARKWRTWFA
jgi:hypothetical protein